ncbi:MAG: hypothetical protein GY856_24885 [bacterium]|nr:hypothetical protein [bacterium]
MSDALLAGKWPVVDPEPCLALLEERFGIPREIFDDYVVFRPNAKTVWIADRRLRLPPRPDPAAVGMPFFHTRARYPRPTSAAAMKFGRHATRNVVDLDAQQVRELVAQRDVRLTSEQERSLTGTGYVFARYRGIVLTVGLYRAQEEGGVLIGAVPKSWSAVVL